MFFITKFGLNAQSLKYVVLLKEEGFTDKENFLELNGALIVFYIERKPNFSKKRALNSSDLYWALVPPSKKGM